MQESGENYLETILLLKQRDSRVRSIDIARHLGFAKPSVSRAVGILKREGFIRVDHGGLIELTEKGQKKADEIHERHRIISDYLVRTLHIDEKIAETDACRIEHVISTETFEKIRGYVEKFRKMFDSKLK